MKPRFANQKTAALTLTEVLIVIAALVLLAAIFLPPLAAWKHKSNRVGCVSSLREIGITCRMWADDSGGKFPMQIPVTNEGAMELIAAGNVAACFSVLSNTLSNPAILICPNDANHFPATNFATLENSNISYFVSLDTIDTQPQSLLSGDDNLIVNGKKVHSGILNLHTSDVLAWTKERHQSAGNLLLGDGSGQQATSADLTSIARLATNRLAIP
ncbi:MAG TPA: type II secretion system protein [Candidatus Sulfopaludibacter sp.]|nr:type II secretion system protein [Candidatus Sulfopaludibacter sp.]